MRKAVDRFWEVVFTPSIRWYRMPKPEIRYPRFPAPGSEPINHEMNHQDYKVAFRDSTHQIRYHRDNIAEVQDDHYIADAIGDTVADKLVKFGYIQPSQRGDQAAIQTAVKQYESEIGEPISQRYHMDNYQEIDSSDSKEYEGFEFKGNRESVAHFVRHFFTAAKDRNNDESWLNSLDDIYNPQIYQFKTYDIADEAVFRQLKCDLEWQLEQATLKREKQGFMPIFKGDPKFWDTLDNSFSPEHIKQVNTSLGVDAEEIDTNALALQTNTSEYHGKDRIEYPFRTQLA